MAATRLGSASGESSANQAPSGNCGCSRCATARASSVLPIPPPPAKVTSRCSPISFKSAATSASRPISVLLDDPIGLDACHQRVFADDRTARLDERHQHVERAASEFDRSTLRSRQCGTTRKRPNATPTGDLEMGSMSRTIARSQEFSVFLSANDAHALPFAMRK